MWDEISQMTDFATSVEKKWIFQIWLKTKLSSLQSTVTPPSLFLSHVYKLASCWANRRFFPNLQILYLKTKVKTQGDGKVQKTIYYIFKTRNKQKYKRDNECRWSIFFLLTKSLYQASPLTPARTPPSRSSRHVVATDRAKLIANVWETQGASLNLFLAQVLAIDLAMHLQTLWPYPKLL